VLAQLTGLQRLDLHCTEVGDKGLLQLTALTKLTRLSASFCRFSSRVSSRVATRIYKLAKEGCLEVEEKVSRRMQQWKCRNSVYPSSGCLKQALPHSTASRMHSIAGYSTMYAALQQRMLLQQR
jgi:hypothetical protein